jgi:DNA polymerase/3'-5' exonuclease PolX
MSGATTRVPLDEAREIAGTLVALLGTSCLCIEIAGSIRRGAPDCGDIDLVCEPRTTPLLDLFGEPTGEVIDHLHERLCDLERLGTVSKRRNALGQASWGPALKRAVYGGLSVDIQAVRDPDTWGAWLLIRTGPADFNKKIVTSRTQGGYLPMGMRFADGFTLYRPGGVVVPTPDERDVFAALGMAWIAPEDRR